MMTKGWMLDHLRSPSFLSLRLYLHLGILKDPRVEVRVREQGKRRDQEKGTARAGFRRIERGKRSATTSIMASAKGYAHRVESMFASCVWATTLG